MSFFNTSAAVAIASRSWIDDLRKSAETAVEKEIVADLTTVSHICSQDISELIRIHFRLKADGRKLVLENALEPVAEVFRITRLDRLIEIRARPVTAAV